MAGLLFRVDDRDPQAKPLATLLVEGTHSTVPGNLATSRVFGTCLESFSGATYVAVELKYFDLDSRSNAKATVDLRHSVAPLSADRLIFLRSSSETSEPFDLVSTLNLIDHSEVLGYMVVVPDLTGPVGRSIIPLPAVLEGARAGVEPARQVRTPVSEYITLFGSTRRVRGVPFMQQDGNVLTCSHVAAWMVHYAAVLRGLVARRPSVSFHTEPSSSLVRGRVFPSPGLTAPQVAVTLGKFGLPADDLSVLELELGGRMARWYDRDAIWKVTEMLTLASREDSPDFVVHHAAIGNQAQSILERIDRIEAESDLETLDAVTDLIGRQEELASLNSKLAELDLIEEQIGRFWTRELLTRVVCQHLNSGFPSILLHNGHAKVIIGYLRRGEYKDVDFHFAGDEFSSPSDVVAFVAADDQVGPYTVLEIDLLLDEMYGMPHMSQMLLPLPKGIWVGGVEAEDLGARVFEGGLDQCLKAISSEAENLVVHHVNDDGLSRVSEALSSLAAEIEAGKSEPSDLSVRSYLTLSTDYKRLFPRRCADEFAQNQVRVASLPKWVWVVEVLRRSERSMHRACVVGEVLLDATDTDLREANAYVLHLPGMIQVRGHGGIGRWHATANLDLYESGRHHGKSEVPDDYEVLLARMPKALI